MQTKILAANRSVAYLRSRYLPTLREWSMGKTIKNTSVRKMLVVRVTQNVFVSYGFCRGNKCSTYDLSEAVGTMKFPRRNPEKLWWGKCRCWSCASCLQLARDHLWLPIYAVLKTQAFKLGTRVP